jgi:aldehyde dehydrogenase (NAD+)
MAMPQTIETYRHPFADGGFKRSLINGEWVRVASGKTFGRHRRSAA